MIYLLTMSLFAFIGFLIGKFKQKWPWFWLISLPVGMCAAIMIADYVAVPNPTEVTFRELVPIFFIPPNLLAIIIGFQVGKKLALP
jgi:hypothetical protein